MPIQITLIGLRGAAAPFLGVGLMHILGTKTIFTPSFAFIPAFFFIMRSFKKKAGLGAERDLLTSGEKEFAEEWIC